MQGSFRSVIRLCFIAFLAFVSLIPLMIVDGIADERQGYFHMAQNDVANTWGLPQQVTGPVLLVPVDYAETQPEAGWRADTYQRQRARKHIILLPEELRVDASADHELRKRAIYEIALFSVDMRVEGRFENPRERISAHVASVPGWDTEIDWQGARLVLGINDPRAIRLPVKAENGSGAESAGVLAWNDTRAEFEPSEFDELVGRGVQAVVTMPDEGEDASFELNLGLGTTQSFGVSALGGVTSYALESSWPHPGFQGDHSPVEREISSDGFAASWEVHGLARSLPDLWVHEDRPRSLTSQRMEVAFHNPVTSYTSIDRGIKYGLLFIALTFLTFLCVELIMGAHFHIVQYAVVSLGLVMFYMTLLAASEHLSFRTSYGLSTLLITSLLGAYAWGMTRVLSITGLIGGVVLLLYGSLYILLQLEDFALLVGTALLLIALAALMFATRNLHWSGAESVQ